MKPLVILTTFLIYTVLLFFITWLTARKANSEGFFRGNKSSPWFVIAYGMIGASLSGVTFMSVPGLVGTSNFTYMMLVLGYLIGYTVIATILMPMYYRLNLTSIYSYLEQRFGFWSYKTGSFFFLLSRTIGASFRMFLVVNVLQIFIFDAWSIPFFVTVSIFILLILLYTFKGGIKTIIWTDTLQTTFMLAAVLITVYLIKNELHLSFSELITRISESKYSSMWDFDINSKKFFVKQFLSGAFIAIVMTGLDQEMMQKNLSCKNLRDAQKNMFTFSFILVFVNLLFLSMGAIIYMFATEKGIEIPQQTDDLFPIIALKYLSPVAGLVFIIGLISAAYPSADGALTSLTTSFCIDFLGLKKREELNEKQKENIRYRVHFSFALILLIIIVIYKTINDRAIIDKLFTIAGYTYGPLLGMYSFGLFTKWKVYDKLVPVVAVISPIVCYIISINSGTYKFGFELLILNGMLTFGGLFLLSRKWFLK